MHRTAPFIESVIGPFDWWKDQGDDWWYVTRFYHLWSGAGQFLIHCLIVRHPWRCCPMFLQQYQLWLWVLYGVWGIVRAVKPKGVYSSSKCCLTSRYQQDCLCIVGVIYRTCASKCCHCLSSWWRCIMCTQFTKNGNVKLVMSVCMSPCTSATWEE
jgi:hypothetical protein